MSRAGTRKARLYRRWRAYHQRMVAASDAIGSGFWLGLLDRPDLHAVDQFMYEGRSSYRDDMHNLRGLFGWERIALEAHFPDTGHLLVVGAGGGREVLALARQGHRVVGYECNPALVAYGQELLRRFDLADAELHLLARDAAPPGGGPYDGIVVGWSAYMLIAGSRNRIEFLRGLRALVRPGAPLLVSFFTRSTTQRASIVAAVANAVRWMRRRPSVELGDDLAPNYVHRFTESEITAELQAGGFTPREFWPQGAGPTDSGWAVGTASDIWVVASPTNAADSRTRSR